MGVSLARKGFYLYKRSGSNNFWLRLVYPPELAKLIGRRRVERSLGTSDRTTAEALASEEIRKHKLALFALKRQREGKPQPSGPMRRYATGTTTFEGDLKIIATDEALIYIDKDDRYIKTEPNHIDINLTNAIEHALGDSQYRWLSPLSAQIARKFVSTKEIGDFDIFERWVKRNKVTEHIRRDALNVWNQFREMVDFRPVKFCKRRNAVEFVEQLSNSGLAAKTVAKKISYLSAAFNIAVQDEILSTNIFSGVAPKIRRDWNNARLCLSDQDMDTVRANLDRLSSNDRLLWILLATTGMRLSEPFEVVKEDVENGHRFITVGTKTPSSRRRVPLPDAVLEFLPAQISGPLFVHSPETHGKRLRYFLRRLEISRDPLKGTGDPRKTVHSLRHRAATRLRAADCPADVQDEILGHTLITVADGYGKGRSITKLKEYQKAIGH